MSAFSDKPEDQRYYYLLGSKHAEKGRPMGKYLQLNAYYVQGYNDVKGKRLKQLWLFNEEVV